VAQLLFNGFITGLLIALPALALSLTFSVLRFANFAIGSLLTVSAYIVLYFNISLGWSFIASIAAGIVVTIVVALITNALVHHPLRERSSLTQLVASMGVAFFLENLVRLIAGNAPRGYAVEIARPIRFWGLRVNQEQGIILLSVVLSLLVVWVIFRFTRLGRSMRAVADNPDLASVRGISYRYVVGSVWVLVGIITTISGTLIGLDAALNPLMGANYVLPVFAASILGGIASPIAAVAGAILLGITEELSTLLVPPHYRTIIAYVIMTLLLMLRPSGLFGSQWVKK
jgi:branched-subunit amino acid ABC-type transport system permease component